MILRLPRKPAVYRSGAVLAGYSTL